MPTTIDSSGIIFNDTSTITSANTFIAKPASPSNGQVLGYNGSTWTGTSLSAAPMVAKAWVNFDGTTSGTWNGGGSTVTRVAGSTTATVTTTSNHGLTSGNRIYVLTGVVAGEYTVNVLTEKTFTITTVATTALNAVAITFRGSTIRDSYNVSSISKLGDGNFNVNFIIPMKNSNYAAMGSTGTTSGARNLSIISYSNNYVEIATSTSTTATWTDFPNTNLVVFEN